MNAFNMELNDRDLVEDNPVRFQKRKDSCLFIAAVGRKCDIGQLAIATASVYFHLFYARVEGQEYDRHEIAVTCLFLAGKVEERGKRVSELIRAYFETQRGATKTRIPQKDSVEFEEMRTRMYSAELRLMSVIEYNFKVTHPYAFLMRYLRVLFGAKYANRSEDYAKALKERGGLAQTAWFFVNDSLRSPLCLKFPPDTIAVAVMYLTLKHEKMTVTKHPDVKKKEEEQEMKTGLAAGKTREAILHEQQTRADQPWWQELFKKEKYDLEVIARHILHVIESINGSSHGKQPNNKHAKPGHEGARVRPGSSSSSAVRPHPSASKPGRPGTSSRPRGGTSHGQSASALQGTRRSHSNPPPPRARPNPNLKPRNTISNGNSSAAVAGDRKRTRPTALAAATPGTVPPPATDARPAKKPRQTPVAASAAVGGVGVPVQANGNGNNGNGMATDNNVGNSAVSSH